MGEPLRIANVNVFDSVEGRVGGPSDVTVGDPGRGRGARGPVLIGP
jgi:hypothetical protein